MKKIILRFVDIICAFISLFISHSFLSISYYLKTRIISNIIKRKFGKCGDNFKIGLNCHIYNPQNIYIGSCFNAFDNNRIEAFKYFQNQEFNPKIIIGNNVSINYNCHIGCINEIRIDDNVLIASNVYITDHMHGFISNFDLSIPPNKRDLYSKGKVHICKNVWIGENVTILPNVKIGKNVIIGANSVVTRSIEDNKVVGGVPARTIRNL